MAIKEVIVFEAADGQKFDTREMAERHERLQGLGLELRQNPCVYDIDYEGLAEWILANFERKLK